MQTDNPTPEAGEDVATFEARRVLALALADVCPDDAKRIRRGKMDTAQSAAVACVAFLVRRFDQENVDG